MKVLHLIPYMHPSAGGPPVVVDQWCAELARRGWQPEVLTTHAYAPDEQQGWIEAYRSRYPIQVCAFRGPKGFAYSSELQHAFCQRLLDVDLVHVHNVWSYCNRLAARWCPRLKIPFVVSTHGMLDPHSMGRKPWKKRLYGRLVEWRGLRQAAGIVFTHPEEERLARQTCATLPAGFVVPLGTEEPPGLTRQELCEQFLQKFPACRDVRRVLFLSRLHPKKGLDLLLPAFRQVLAELPQTQLLLVGPGEADYVRGLQREIAELGLAGQVLLTGALHGVDKWAALAAADVYVLPSYQENFAIALVEALRVGTPVVCSQRVNLWSDLQQAGAATVCELTVDSVARSILGLLQNTEQAGRQGERGAALAAERFTWPASTDLLMQVYRAVLGGGVSKTTESTEVTERG